MQCLLHDGVEKRIEEHVDPELSFLITLNCTPLGQIQQAKSDGDEFLGCFAMEPYGFGWKCLMHDTIGTKPSGETGGAAAPSTIA